MSALSPPTRTCLIILRATRSASSNRDARCSINGHSAVLNSDGSVTIVLSRGMTSHPNSLTALGYPRGNLAFRWFLSDGVPERPEVELVKVSQAPTGAH